MQASASYPPHQWAGFTAQQIKFVACLLALCFAWPCLPGMGSDVGSKAAGKIATSLIESSKNILQASVNIKDGVANIGTGTFKYLGAAAKGLWRYGAKVLAAHPNIAKTAIVGVGAAAITIGTAIIAAPVALSGYVSHRWLTYHRRSMLELRMAEQAARVALEDHENKMRIAKEAAAATCEIMRREIKIKEEAAAAACAIMKRKAKIQDGLIIAGAATVAVTGLSYAGYRLYRSIQDHRHQGSPE